MGQYSIKDLENFTRIKAHTLRIWEQRYSLLNPKRTDTNIRYYTERDLKKILNINLLYTNGLKISKIAKLSEPEIFRLANEILLNSSGGESEIIDRFINLIVRFDEKTIVKELNAATRKKCLEDTFSDIIVPVLKKIGELWQVDSITISHEHFFSNLLREFIIAITSKLPAVKDPKAHAILFLNEEEYHELGLLFYNYILRKRGYSTLYLGQAVPMVDMERIIKEINPDYVFTSLTAKMDEASFKKFFDELSEFISLSKVYSGGYQLNVYREIVPDDVNVIDTVHAIDLV